MRGGIPTIVRQHPVATTAALLAAAFALTVATTQILGWMGYATFSARLRAISAAAPSGRTRTLLMEFPFRGRRWRVAVVVDETQLAAERALPTEGVFNSAGALREAYVRTLVENQAGGPVVTQLARGLRDIRRTLRLDDDEYVELMAAAVQNQTYGTPRWRIELPAAEVAQGWGVCSDRSVLLGSLLRHEGYDTVLWVFVNEHHIAVGVRGIGEGYHRTGYAFIETTRPSLIGDAATAFATAGIHEWQPQMICVGGRRRYRADIEAAFVLDRFQRAEARSTNLSIYTDAARAAHGAARACYADLAREHATTTAFARFIAAGLDDRPRLYAVLAASGLGR